MGSNRKRSQAGVTEARLSPKQRFWLKHLQACEAGGETLKGYAKRKGLSVHGLYGARRRMRLAGEAPASANSEKRLSFAKVVVREAPAEAGRCRVRLPNGAVMEWDIPLTAQSLELLFQTVARLS
ncbi:MAG: IS66 family insertion sequence element accessory protein TnpA [Planctomycetota bacterium]|jgi:hypothetical protein